MWNYLKSDIEELISVVKEDSNVVLEKMQDEQAVKKATAASREADRRMAMEETYLTPLLQDDDDDDDDEYMDSNERSSVEEFLKAFRIDDKTDEISSLLEEHELLKEYFEALVPQHVTYEAFWSRFFYRCDAHRIQTMNDAEEEAARIARAELVGSVSTFLGGAAKTIASSVKEVVTTKEGRPPFVMNTAVDEDGDEEEEELGWDDEEDEEEENDLAVESLDDDVIEFQDEALETAKEQLKQTEIERDQLQETVELLKKELATQQTAEGDASKDDEIASLKASLAQMTIAAESNAVNSSNDTASEAAKKIRELTEAVSNKDREFSVMKTTLEAELKSVRSQLTTMESQSKANCDALTLELQASQEQCKTVTSQLEDVKAQLERLQRERECEEEANHQHTDDGKASEDSGVPVEPPIMTKEVKTSNDDDESDGWGDDWD